MRVPTLSRHAVALTVLLAFVIQAGEVSARRRSKQRTKWKPPAGKVGPGGKGGGNVIAEGKAHLKKANALAGEDNCEAAVKEYTAAYDRLGDPVVLFNRGECYRRLGDAAKAVEDYEDFLEEVPNAPNRTDIEAKIAALEKTLKVSTPEPEKSPERGTEPPAASPSAQSPTLPEVPAPKAEAVLARPRVVDVPAEERSWSRSWVWIGVGALVVGGIAGAYLAFRPEGATPPRTTLGNYPF